MRRPLSTKARLALFLAHDGKCHVCGGRIQPGDGWDVEHRIPLAMGGEDGGDNLAPVHRKGCHSSKTATDLGDIARAKRREALHLGAKARASRPIPGSRASGLSKRMNGTVERRK